MRRKEKWLLETLFLFFFKRGERFAIDRSTYTKYPYSNLSPPRPFGVAIDKLRSSQAFPVASRRPAPTLARTQCDGTRPTVGFPRRARGSGDPHRWYAFFSSVRSWGRKRMEEGTKVKINPAFGTAGTLSILFLVVLFLFFIFLAMQDGLGPCSSVVLV